jgi:putative AbiEi antitoxin of type IV toxin-antitoxin system
MDIAEVPRVARRQAGVFTAAQALAEGWSRRTIRRRLASARWCYVTGWALARRPPVGQVWTGFQLAVAAWLTIPGAVISHRTAGLMHGFPLEPVDAECAHVICLHRRSGRNIVVHRLRLDDNEIEHHSCGLRFTSEQRTALDLLTVLALPNALDLWAWVCSRKIVAVADLEAAIGRRRYWHGRPRLQELLDLVRDGAVSGAEWVLHSLLREAGSADGRRG